MAALADPVLLLFLALGAGMALVLSGSRGVRMSSRRARVGVRLLVASWAGGWIVSTTGFAALMGRAVATAPVDLRAALADVDPDKVALVVLSGGGRDLAPGEAPAEALRGSSAERAIGAARVFADHSFGHVIVSGRAASAAPERKHQMVAGMAAIMVGLGVPEDRIRLEADAIDTRQNAMLSARLARELGAECVVVVTSALHMRRAMQSFARTDIRALPAPVDPDPPPVASVLVVLPSMSGLWMTSRVMHELIGLLEP